jgi:hypothetical protein
LDVSRFRIGDWVLVGAGAAMLVLGLAVPWVTVTFRGNDLPGARNAFDYPLTGGIAWVLVVAAGVITFLRAARLLADGTTPWTRLVVAATALAVLLLVLRVLLGPGSYAGADLGRGAGMIVATVAAVTALGGALANHRAEGGTLRDLWAFGGRATPPLSSPATTSAPGDDVAPPPP